LNETYEMPEDTIPSACPGNHTTLWDCEAAVRRLVGENQMLYELIGYFNDDVTPLIESVNSV